MKLRYRILLGMTAVVAIALAFLAYTISRTDPCGPAPQVAAGTRTMQAVVSRCYGSPDTLTVEQVPMPELGEHDVLIRVRAAAVNPLDWHYMRGSPYLMRLGTGLGAPDDPRTGVDFAGVVETVGSGVTRFRPGDEVFGGGNGAFAEYLSIGEEGALARKPDNVTFEQAAALPIAAITALQALRDKGQLEAGQKVLINGASGGVGTFAVQIAKWLGADVTGVCSTRNVELVLGIGADRVIDYRNEDYTVTGGPYDLIIDMVGNRTIGENRSVLKPGGTYVIVGGAKGDWLGPLTGPVKAAVTAPFVDEELVMLLASMNGKDLEVLADLLASGAVIPVIDRRYPLAEVPEALRYSESGRARGKIIVTME